MATTATRFAKKTVDYEEEVPTVSSRDWVGDVFSHPKDKVSISLLFAS